MVHYTCWADSARLAAMGKASHVLCSPWTYVSFCVPLEGRVLVNAVILHRQVVHCLSCGIAAEAVLVESPETEKQILKKCD